MLHYRPIACLLSALLLMAHSGHAAPTAFGFPPPPPMSLAGQQGEWSVYSRNVNKPICASKPSEGSGETWIGTAMGVKRLAADGKLLRVYTRSDGLPGDAVLALAVEAHEAWAIVYTSGRYGLCHLDRATAHWETLREVTYQEPTYTDWTSYPSFISVGSSDFICFVVGSTAFNPGGATLSLLDRHSRTWHDVSLKDARYHASVANWFYARTDRDGGTSVFVATDEGLAEYRVGTGGWRRQFTDRAVEGATVAADGTLWLATLLNTDHDHQPWFTQLRLVHFDPDNAATLSDDSLPLSHKAYGQDGIDYPGPRRSVVEADDAVWLVDHRGDGFFRSLDSLPNTVRRFDETTHQWSQPPLDGANIPASVLAAAVTADYRLPDNLESRLLPGWVSPAAVVPEPPTALLPPSDGKSVWTEAQGQLIKTPQNGGTATRFPLPLKKVWLTPSVSAVTPLDNTLYALAGDTLWLQKFHNGHWTEHSLPGATPGGYYSLQRLFAAAGRVWVERNGTLWPYDPSTGRFGSSLSAAHGENMIGVENGCAWFAASSTTLTRFLLTDGKTQTVSVELPADFPAAHKVSSFGYRPDAPVFPQALLLHVSAGKAWVTWLTGTNQATQTILRGYDLKDHSWTKSLTLSRYARTFSFYQWQNKLYVAYNAQAAKPVLDWQLQTHWLSSGAVYCFDTTHDRWKNVVPETTSAIDSRLIGADGQAVWLLDHRNQVWRWDVARHAWSCFSAPLQRGWNMEASADGSIRQAEAFYVPSGHGLLRFDVSRGQWSRLAFPEDVRTLRPFSIVHNNAAIWTILGDDRTGTTVARLDQKTHQWQFWDTASGLPADLPMRQVAPCGASALALTGKLTGHLYLLDSRTGQCSDLAPALKKAIFASTSDNSVQVTQMLSDAAGVWLRVSDGIEKPREFLERWDALAGFQTYEIPTVLPVAERNYFSVWPLKKETKGSGDLLWLMLPNGIDRFNTVDKTWRSLLPPPGFPTPVEADARDLSLDSNGAVWLVGTDTALCWRESGDSAEADTSRKGQGIP